MHQCYTVSAVTTEWFECTELLPVTRTYHFDDINGGFYAEEVEELLEVLLDLDAVVLWLGHREDAHGGVSPHLVLSQQEPQQHEDASVVHDPPDVYRAYTTTPRLCILQ